MELRTIRYFLTVAEELNITRAAEKLNMAQPPLSHQMRQLEEELGVTLFERGHRHITLTAEGGLLRQRGRQILELVQKTRTEIHTMKNGISGMLYISTVEGRAPYLMAEWIRGFREEYPHVQYNLWNGSTDDVIDRMTKGLADLAMVLAPYDSERMEAIEVAALPWAAMIPGNHPLASQPDKPIDLRALVGEPLIVPARKSRVQEIYSWFREIGEEPTVVCEMSNFLDAYAMAEKGVGISIFPHTNDNKDPKVVCRDITNPTHIAHYMLGWRADRKPSQLAQLFIDYVQDMQQSGQ